MLGVFVCLSQIGFAQISNYNWMLGGGAKFSQETVTTVSSYQAEISLDAAYLVHLGKQDTAKNSLAFGFRPSFTWNPTEDVYKGVLFARYYFHARRFSPFVEVNSGYRLKNSFSVSTGEISSYTESFVLGGKLGGAFYVAKNVTFDVFFFYDELNSTIHFKQQALASSKNKQYSLGLGLGFQIFLSCKK